MISLNVDSLYFSAGISSSDALHMNFNMKPAIFQN